MTHRIAVYHANCIDGLMSAAIFQTKYPDTEFYPGHYDEDLPWERFTSDTEIFFLDYSAPISVLQALSEQTAKITIIDHHATFYNNYLRWGGKLDLETYYDVTNSGAMLTWKYCYPTAQPPTIIAAIQSRDLWTFDATHTNDIHHYLLSKPLTITSMREALDTPFKEMVIKGVPLYAAAKTKWQELIDELVAYRYILGYEVPVLNIHKSAGYSDILHMLIDGGKEHFAVSWYVTPTRRIFSFRSRELDVAKLLEPYGGGGHEHAAGVSFLHGQVPVGFGVV